MPLPQQTLPIAVNIKRYDGSAMGGATVTFRIGENSYSETADDNGLVVWDIGNLSGGWSIGDILEVYAYKQYYGATSRKFILDGTPIDITLNFHYYNFLSHSTDNLILSGAILSSEDGEKIDYMNALPVTESKPSDWSNADLSVTYNSSNNPTIIEKTVDGDVYRKTITYDSSQNPTIISGWIKQ